jgi:hypothetical protein
VGQAPYAPPRTGRQRRARRAGFPDHPASTGQAAASGSAFDALSASDRNAMLAAMKSD